MVVFTIMFLVLLRLGIKYAFIFSELKQNKIPLNIYSISDNQFETVVSHIIISNLLGLSKDSLVALLKEMIYQNFSSYYNATFRKKNLEELGFLTFENSDDIYTINNQTYNSYYFCYTVFEKAR